mgnify:CR=1 FL=1
MSKSFNKCAAVDSYSLGPLFDGQGNSFVCQGFGRRLSWLSSKSFFHWPSPYEPFTENFPWNSNLFCPLKQRKSTSSEGHISIRVLFSRGSESLFKRPPFLKATLQSLKSHTQVVGPVHEAFGLPIESNQTVGASVPPLDGSCRPDTVLRRVAFVIIIKALNGEFRGRLRPHIAKKGKKGISPFFTDTDPSTSVVLIPGVLRIIASLDHARPDSILWGATHPMLSLGFKFPSNRGRFFFRHAAPPRKVSMFGHVSHHMPCYPTSFSPRNQYPGRPE